MNDYSQFMKLINNCDPDDPLLSSTSLGHRLDQIPMHQIQNFPDDLNKLQALNLEQLVPTNSGLARDYRGLAELMGFTLVEVETRLKQSRNPIQTLIYQFINRNSGAISCPTVNDLLKMLERIERFDMIDDFMPTLIKLAQLDGSSNRASTHMINDQLCPVREPPERTFERITFDDANQNKATMYDAFICFAPEDYEYAEELIGLLEEQNKCVATADDLLPGHFEQDALMRLIDSRCRKVLVVLTPNFLKSRECEFRTKFASELDIKSGGHNIIPVLFEPCDESLMPSMIRVLSKINMTNRISREWQLKKLISSLSYDLQHGSLEPPYLVRPQSRSPDRYLNGADRNEKLALRNEPINSVPMVTFNSNNDETSSINRGPFVELMQSQSSGVTSNFSISSDSTRIESRRLSPTSLNSSQSVNWLRKNVKRLFKGSSSSGPDPTTSQARLLSTSLSEFPDEVYGGRNTSDD